METCLASPISWFRWLKSGFTMRLNKVDKLWFPAKVLKNQTQLNFKLCSNPRGLKTNWSLQFSDLHLLDLAAHKRFTEQQSHWRFSSLFFFPFFQSRPHAHSFASLHLCRLSSTPCIFHGQKHSVAPGRRTIFFRDSKIIGLFFYLFFFFRKKQFPLRPHCSLDYRIAEL